MKTERRKMMDKLDLLCGKVRKEIDDWQCQRCGKPVTGRNAHWSHIFAKGTHINIRWDLNNCITLCFTCHRWWHDESEGKAWFKNKYLARWAYLNCPVVDWDDVLRPRYNSTNKLSVDNLKVIYEALKKKYKEVAK